MNATLSLSADERRVAAIAAYVGCVGGVVLGAVLVPDALFRPELTEVSREGTLYTPIVPLSSTGLWTLALFGLAVAVYVFGDRRDENDDEGDDPTAADPAPHAVLNVAPDASDREVKEAYRERVKEVHPDRGGDEQAFKRVKRAKEELLG